MKRPSSAAVVSTGSLRDGVLRLDDKVATAAELKTVRDGGVVLTVEPAGEDTLRLVKMRKYYRAVVVKRLAAVAWTSVENMHGLLAARFLGHPVTIVSVVTGEEITAIVYRSTSELTSDEFWAFIEQARAFALEHYTLTIPDPDPAWKLHRQEAAA
jgi:hypothetical protein